MSNLETPDYGGRDDPSDNDLRPDDDADDNNVEINDDSPYEDESESDSSNSDNDADDEGDGAADAANGAHTEPVYGHPNPPKQNIGPQKFITVRILKGAERRTIDMLFRFEIAQLKAVRTMQIDLNPHIFLDDYAGLTNAYDIASLEFDERRCPLIIRRFLDPYTCEDIYPNEVQHIKSNSLTAAGRRDAPYKFSVLQKDDHAVVAVPQ